jgi:hypothetical protein
MATVPKSHNDSEWLAESELLRRKTQARVLSMWELIEQSMALILDSKTVLVKLRSHREIERGNSGSERRGNCR